MNPATLTVTLSANTVESGHTVTANAAVAGALSLLNDDVWTPQNMINCAVEPSDNSVRKDFAGNAYNAGVVSAQEITAGEGAFLFVANVPPSFSGYSAFGGRNFFAGLTAKTTVSTFTDIDYALNVWLGGVDIYEAGVQRLRARAARNNAIYQVGIESGQIVYRADGDILYRSGIPFTYPLRAGAAFFHGSGIDHIGGVPLNDATFVALDAAMNPIGSFAGNVWTAPPNTRGRFQIRGTSSNYVVGSAYVDVLKRLPWGAGSGLPRPTRWFLASEEFAVKEQIFDDNGGEWNVPYDEPVRTWRVEYSRKLRADKAAMLDAFYSEHKGHALPFYFYDERTDTLWDNVRFAKDRYTRDHNQVWNQSRTFELIRRPK